jgi:hypothetical protein
MADAVRVPDLHFCEIGQERDGVTVDVGQLPAIKGRRAKGREPLVRLLATFLPWREI